MDILYDEGHIVVSKINSGEAIRRSDQGIDRTIICRSTVNVCSDDGSITGLVTMEDMMETILGLEIIDESDNVADMQALARKRWEERAKKLGIIE